MWKVIPNNQGGTFNYLYEIKKLSYLFHLSTV